MNWRCMLGWHDYTVPKYREPGPEGGLGVWTHTCKRCGKEGNA